MGEYNFTENGFDHYLYWQGQDKKTLKRINQLLKSIDRDGPMNGLGKPEPLKYEDGFSHRIDDTNRLVYKVDDGRIVEYCNTSSIKCELLDKKAIEIFKQIEVNPDNVWKYVQEDKKIEEKLKQKALFLNMSAR